MRRKIVWMILLSSVLIQETCDGRRKRNDSSVNTENVGASASIAPKGDVRVPAASAIQPSKPSAAATPDVTPPQNEDARIQAGEPPAAVKSDIPPQSLSHASVVALRPGVVGVVLDSMMVPVPGAKLLAIDESTMKTVSSSETTANGLFDLEGLSSSVYTIEFKHEGFNTSRHMGIQPPYQLTVILNAGSPDTIKSVQYVELNGVVNQNGMPVSGATVELTETLSGKRMEVRTDKEGKIYLRNVPSGNYDLRTVAAGFEPLEVKNTTIASEGGVKATTLNVQLK